jgi:hypothetical protein
LDLTLWRIDSITIPWTHNLFAKEASPGYSSNSSLVLNTFCD